jgi:hypothetical protein
VRRMILIVMVVFVPLEVRGQCHPPANSNEARLLAFFAAPLSFSEQERLARLSPGTTIVGGDVAWVPPPPPSLRTSSGVCGFEKPEHTNLASLFPRPRLIVGLGTGFAIEASYLPPITVQDATPNLASVALGWTSPLLFGGVDLALRLHTTFGQIQGAIVCPTSALQQTSSSQPCYGTVPSKDTYEPRVWGGEAAVAGAPGRFSWYAGAGVNELSPHFRVGFTSADGKVDHQTIDVSFTRLTMFAGAGWALDDRLTLSAQLYSVPEDATTGRIGIGWRVR